MRTIEISTSSFLLGLALLFAVPFAFFQGHSAGANEAKSLSTHVLIMAANKLVAAQHPTTEQAAFQAIGEADASGVRARFQWTQEGGFAIKAQPTADRVANAVIEAGRFVCIAIVYWCAIVLGPTLYCGLNRDRTFRTKTGLVCVELPTVKEPIGSLATAGFAAFLWLSSNL